MTGGLLQIVTYGSQDLFLTGNPEITFFRTVYRRHTNFSIEAIRVPFDDSVGFGNTCNVSIQKIGDLMHKTYVEITVPEIEIERQLDQTVINELTDEVNTLQRKYDLLKEFLGYNMAAYRNANNYFVMDNITMSTEMIDSITLAFSTYPTADETEFKNMVLDDYNAEYEYVMENGGILYRYDNISGQFGNISLKSINNYWGSPAPMPSVVPKTTTMNIIKYLINNCRALDEKYFNELSVAKLALADAYNSNFKFAWVKKLGHSIIEYIEFSIGGYKIDKHFGQWLDIWYELMGKKDQEDAYFRMIGNISILNTFDRAIKPQYTMLVPLQFFFCRFSGTALPLIALQYSDVSIRIKFRKFSECSYIEDTGTAVSLDDILENKSVDMNANLVIEYIYLDSGERKKFAQASHEYLIEQLQVEYEDNFVDRNAQMDLYFEQPCKGLLWVVQQNDTLQNSDGHKECKWTTYLTATNEIPIITSEMIFSSYTRIEKKPYSYFNYLQPYIHCKNTPIDGINCYWFSLFPEEHQPSGTCNMSRLPNVRMMFNINPYFYDNDKIYTITVYALNYNILRIVGGMGNVAYV